MYVHVRPFVNKNEILCLFFSFRNLSTATVRLNRLQHFFLLSLPLSVSLLFSLLLVARFVLIFGETYRFNKNVLVCCWLCWKIITSSVGDEAVWVRSQTKAKLTKQILETINTKVIRRFFIYVFFLEQFDTVRLTL